MHDVCTDSHMCHNNASSPFYNTNSYLLSKSQGTRLCKHHRVPTFGTSPEENCMIFLVVGRKCDTPVHGDRALASVLRLLLWPSSTLYSDAPTCGYRQRRRRHQTPWQESIVLEGCGWNMDCSAFGCDVDSSGPQGKLLFCAQIIITVVVRLLLLIYFF